jgi:hypothetical protein
MNRSNMWNISENGYLTTLCYLEYLPILCNLYKLTGSVTYGCMFPICQTCLHNNLQYHDFCLLTPILREHKSFSHRLAHPFTVFHSFTNPSADPLSHIDHIKHLLSFLWSPSHRSHTLTQQYCTGSVPTAQPQNTWRNFNVKAASPLALPLIAELPCLGDEHNTALYRFVGFNFP